MNVGSLIVFPFWLYLYLCADRIHKWNPNITALIAGFIIMIPLHEFLHFVTTKMSKKQIKAEIGYKPIFTIFIKIEGDIQKKDRILFLIFPFLILTPVGLLTPYLVPSWGMTFVILNAVNSAGSISDFYRLAKIIKTKTM